MEWVGERLGIGGDLSLEMKRGLDSVDVGRFFLLQNKEHLQPTNGECKELGIGSNEDRD